MKIHVNLVLSLGLVGCGGSAPPLAGQVDLALEEQAIREADARWMNASVHHDPVGEAAEYAPDGVEYRPNMAPIVGPAALQAFDAKFFAEHPAFVASWTTKSVHIAASGDLAITLEDVDVRGLGPTGDGSDKAIGLTVWKKVDGQWKIAHAMGSSIVPAGAAPQK